MDTSLVPPKNKPFVKQARLACRHGRTPYLSKCKETIVSMRKPTKPSITAEIHQCGFYHCVCGWPDRSSKSRKKRMCTRHPVWSLPCGKIGSLVREEMNYLAWMRLPRLTDPCRWGTVGVTQWDTHRNILGNGDQASKSSFYKAYMPSDAHGCQASQRREIKSKYFLKPPQGTCHVSSTADVLWMLRRCPLPRVSPVETHRPQSSVDS